MSEKSEQCVEVEVKDGQVVLSVGIDFLATSVEEVLGPELMAGDKHILAADIAEVLRAGEITPLEDLFDNCIQAVADSGSEGVVENDDDLSE